MSGETCQSCNGTGQRMVIVNHCAADGTTYQGLEYHPCPGCNGTGQRS